MDKIEYLRLTVLCENVVANLAGIGEHGFSVYIETDIGNYLFDTGSGIGILHNADVFQKDLKKIKKIMLSHGHYDHTGGLSQTLSRTGEIEVYCHPDVFHEKYAISKEEFKKEKRFIGIPHRQTYLESKGAVFKFSKEFQEIEKGMFLTGEIPRLYDYEQGDPRLSLRTEEGFIKDPLWDDQALVFSTKKGIVVLLGCAHAGIINTLDFIGKKLGVDRFYAVVGGTHLGLVGENQFKRSIEALKGFNMEKMGLSHCTGIEASFMIKREFGERSFYASVGTSLEIT
ncbi:MAG TPA: MBL fold metallo-hydrolase [Syntrophorhabdaceae bacterium]|nr:MBL fold metallo-hydrolase [Syntrophorhabdaceae bacterium]